jgi:hypothetical protein
LPAGANLDQLTRVSHVRCRIKQLAASGASAPVENLQALPYSKGEQKANSIFATCSPSDPIGIHNYPFLRRISLAIFGFLLIKKKPRRIGLASKEKCEPAVRLG